MLFCFCGEEAEIAQPRKFVGGQKGFLHLCRVCYQLSGAVKPFRG